MTLTLQYAPMADGCLVRMQGRATMQVSPCFRTFLSAILESDDETRIVIDVAECNYFDSTFLGCLISLHRKSAPDSKRLAFFADAKKQKELFGSCQLDRVFNLTEEQPNAVGQFADVPLSSVDENELGRHIAECHLRLAEMETEDAEKFRCIAERLLRELEE